MDLYNFFTKHVNKDIYRNIKIYYSSDQIIIIFILYKDINVNIEKLYSSLEKIGKKLIKNYIDCSVKIEYIDGVLEVIYPTLHNCSDDSILFIMDMN